MKRQLQKWTTVVSMLAESEEELANKANGPLTLVREE